MLRRRLCGRGCREAELEALYFGNFRPSIAASLFQNFEIAVIVEVIHDLEGFILPEHRQRGERLKSLLSRGYFPAELPETFSTISFGNSAISISEKWSREKWDNFWTEPEDYTVARYGDVRRKLSIVNPVNQLRVSEIISKNWHLLRQVARRSNISEFVPEIVYDKSRRSVSGVDFDSVSRKTSQILSQYGRYVRTDISRFYSSIYTHSIAWAIHGKEWCKENHQKPEYRATVGSKLDKAVSAGQAGQTVGIPIGPDTSRILSELVATEIERLMASSVSDLSSRGVRYVDDMYLGLEDEESPAAVLSGLSGALYEFGLEVNAEKTSVCGVGLSHSPEWVHFVRNFEVSSRWQRQREDLDSFFEHAVYLADQHHRENVLLYAAKRAASFEIDERNMSHLTRWLLYLARRSPGALGYIAEHLSAIAREVQLPTEEIRDYITNLLPRYAAAARTDEVSWLLYWVIQRGYSIPPDCLEKALSLRSSVVAIQVAHLMDEVLIEGGIDMSYWQSFASVAGLKSPLWLASYEITKRNWWPALQNRRFLDEHKYFRHLVEEDVTFYEKDRKAKSRASRPFAHLKRFDVGPYGYRI